MNLEKEQSEKSAKIKQIMQDNPDLSYEFVRHLQATLTNKASPSNYIIHPI